LAEKAMATMFDDVMNYFRCNTSPLDTYLGMRDVAMGCLYISIFLEVEKGGIREENQGDCG
jgi:hypothetical protein